MIGLIQWSHIGEPLEEIAEPGVNGVFSYLKNIRPDDIIDKLPM
jgi:hypothetical protein